jgi:hypothetical protein
VDRDRCCACQAFRARVRFERVDDPWRCLVYGYLAGGVTGAIGCRGAHICGLSESCWVCGRSVWAWHVACDLRRSDATVEFIASSH